MGKKKKKKSQVTSAGASGSTSSEIDMSQMEDLTVDFSQFLDACRYGRVEEVRAYVTEHAAEMADNPRLQHFALYYTLAIPFVMPAQYKKPEEEKELPTAYHEGHFSTVDFLLETFSSVNLNQRSCFPSFRENHHQFYITSAIYYLSPAMLDKLIQEGTSLDLSSSDQTELLEMIIHRLENISFRERQEAEKILLLLLPENKKKEIFSKEHLELGFRHALEEGCFRLATLFLKNKIGSLNIEDFEIIGQLLILHVQELFYLKKSREPSYSHFLEEEKRELDNLVDAIINDFTEKKVVIQLLKVLPQVIGSLSNMIKKIPDVARKGSDESEHNKIYVNILKHYVGLLEKHYKAFLDKEFGSNDSSDSQQKSKKSKRGKEAKKSKEEGRAPSAASSSAVASQLPDSHVLSCVSAASTPSFELESPSLEKSTLNHAPDRSSTAEEREDDRISIGSVTESDKAVQDPPSSSMSTPTHDLDLSSIIEGDNQTPPIPEAEDSPEARIQRLLSNETVNFIFEVIEEQKGYAYLTGGAVRDLFSKKESRDFDYITNLSAAAIYDALKKKGCSVRSSRVMPNLITVEYQGAHIDLVCNRPLNIREDATTKDFRCNALYLNREGDVIEILPGSIEDAKNSILTPTSSWQTIFSVPDCFPSEYNHFWYLDKNPYRIMRALEFVMRGFAISDIHHFRACARTIFLSQESENAEFQIQRVLNVYQNIQEKQAFLNHLVGCGLMDEPSRMSFCSEALINAKNILFAIESSFPMPQISYAYVGAGFFSVDQPPLQPVGYVLLPAFTP